MKSDSIKKGIERAPHRSLPKAIGFTDGEIRRQLIGIANSAGPVFANGLIRRRGGGRITARPGKPMKHSGNPLAGYRPIGVGGNIPHIS